MLCAMVGHHETLLIFIVKGQRAMSKKDLFSKDNPGTENWLADALSQLNHCT